jgi:adenine phosphoribosyltransferase
MLSAIPLLITIVVSFMCYSGWRLKKLHRDTSKSSTIDVERGEAVSLLAAQQHSSGNGEKNCKCLKALPPSGEDSSDKTFHDKCWHDIYNEFQVYSMSGRTIHSAMRDFFELVRHPELCHNFLAFLAIQVHQRYPDVDVIIGIDTNGFLVSLLAAQELRRPFVPVRKLRDLPGDVYKVDYFTRDNKGGSMAIQKSVFTPGQKVVIIDEKLASGGTMLAAVELIKMTDVHLLGCVVVVEDSSYNGREKVGKKYPDVDIMALFITASEGPSCDIPSSDNSSVG